MEDRDRYLNSPVHLEKSPAGKSFAAGGLSPRQYELEKSKFQMSNKMIDKLETKYHKESSAIKSVWDLENENKEMGGKVKPKYITNKQDQTLFTRLVPSLPETFETNTGTRAAIEETKGKIKKHDS